MVALPYAAASEAAGKVVDRVAAVVNDEVITVSEVYELGQDYIETAVTDSGPTMRRTAEHAVLERLIERTLVDQEVIELKLEATEQDLDRAIDDLARRNGIDREGLRRELEREGMTWEDYRTELRGQLRDLKFQQSVLRPRVTITEDELRDLWLRSGGGAGAEVATVQGVVLAVPKDADAAAIEGLRAKLAQAKAMLDTGVAFSEVAATYDEGPYRATGGEMGKFGRGELVPVLDGPVFSSPVGQPVVVETANALFLLRVTSRQKVDSAFDDAREKLTEQIFASRMEEEKERWFEQARREAVVKVLLPGGDGRGPKAPR